MIRILPIFLFLFFSLRVLCQDDGNHFPFYFQDDEKPRSYSKFRAEGASPAKFIFNSVKYFRKYKNKRTTYHTAGIEYFERQQTLFEFVLAQNKGLDNEQFVGFGMLGDLMWIRNNWNDFVDTLLLHEMRKYDFWLGNLESPVAENRRVRSFFPDYVKYNADTGLVTSFRHIDGQPLFRALSFANNHVLDMGEKGAKATFDFLCSKGILVSGVTFSVDEKSWVGFTEKGIRFGFYAGCWGVNIGKKLKKTGMKVNILSGIAPVGIDEPDLREILAVLEEMEADGVDIKIISLHWGAEYEMYPHVSQVLIARKLVEGGADIIMGHHPHVIQPFEVYFVNGYEQKYVENEEFSRISEFAVLLTDSFERPRKALVAYSLGNFTTQMYTSECLTGAMVGLYVFRDKSDIVDWEIADIMHVYNEKKGGKRKKHRLVLMKKEGF